MHDSFIMLDLRLERLKTWWSHKVDKDSSVLFYENLYSLHKNAWDILNTVPSIDSYMEKLTRILEIEESFEFLNIFHKEYKIKKEKEDRFEKDQIMTLGSFGHPKEQENLFAGNWRSWGKALITYVGEDIDNTELFKNARQNGLHVEEEWGYISIPSKPVYSYFTRKQLNDFYKDKICPLPTGA